MLVGPLIVADHSRHGEQRAFVDVFFEVLYLLAEYLDAVPFGIGNALAVAVRIGVIGSEAEAKKFVAILSGDDFRVLTYVANEGDGIANLHIKIGCG